MSDLELEDARPHKEQYAAKSNDERRALRNVHDDNPIPGTYEPTENRLEHFTQVTRAAAKGGRKIIIPRANAPAVSKVVDDALQSVAMQMHQYRSTAHLEVWDSTKAIAFTKLVSALVNLQVIENKQVESFALGEVADDDLKQLEAKAAEYLRQQKEP